MRNIILALGLALGVSTASGFALQAQAQSGQAPNEILNVSYDIGRELYEQVNAAFIPLWKEKTGETLSINQSHAGSSKQARSILEGLEADVVTFNQVLDVQVLADKGKLIPADWQSRLANNSSPYYSLPAFLVRAGNPKQIKNWDDLVRDDVQVIFPNPKTSGNGRYTYLAATAYAYEAFNKDDAKVREFISKLFKNVPVFDTGGRGATTTFAERGIGDVLVTFEAEVLGTQKMLGADKYQVVVPPISLLSEFPVTIVDKVADKRGSREIVQAYLDFLYAPQGQEILASNFNRVHDASVLEKYKTQFPDVKLVRVEDAFGGWEKVNKDHFAEGGILDQLFTAQ